MITTEEIKKVIDQELVDKDCFLVDLAIREGNNILVEIDSLNGLSINDCVAFSKEINKHFDRDVEDFELLVSSPGLDKPFKVKEQYQKNIGREIKVVKSEGEVTKGLLKGIEEDKVIIEHSYKKRIEGRKKKETIVEQESIAFNNIKETTIIISFKK